MPRRVALSLLLICAVVTVTAQTTRPVTPPAAPSRPGVLATLRTSHPRLLVLDADLPAVQRRLAAEVHLRGWHDRLRQQARQMLDEPVVAHRPSGSGLLAESRAALHRITTLAGIFLIDGDQRALARAKAEMRAVAAFPDWNPSHFLDVAEMTAAMALGYDWLYSDLTPEERVGFRTAIIAKGLTPGVEAIRTRAFWAVAGSNTWSEVCFGGLTLGALAVADHAPDLAASIVNAIQEPAFRSHLRRFAPDGGDVEGAGYWGYSTTYIAYLLAGLETALGGDFGLGDSDGLAATGQFRMFSVGTSLRQLNYGDAVEAPAAAPQMLWMAGRYDRPEYAAHEHGWLLRSGTPPSILHLLWSVRPPARPASLPPTSRHFRGVDIAVLRGDWRDPLASWVALKAGGNAGTVGHLDLGSVVIDALGERWAVDLGSDHSDLPEYFGARRPTYFRVRTESHNTLQVEDRNQHVTASAPIVGFGDDSYRAFAIADLTTAYQPALTRARRGVALYDGRDVLIQDEFEVAEASRLAWQMATRAEVTTSGGRVVELRQNGRSATLRVIEPADATIQVAAPEVPAPQAPADVLVVKVALPAALARQRVVVWFSTGDRPPPAVTPLDAWQ